MAGGGGNLDGKKEKEAKDYQWFLTSPGQRATSSGSFKISVEWGATPIFEEPHSINKADAKMEKACF